MSGANRRQHERVLAQGVAIRVKFAGVAELEQYFLRDISRGGIFLRAKNLKPMRSQLTIVLAMPDGGEVKLLGEVVHVIPPEQATPGQPSGMGVQFTNLTPELLAQINDYVERLKRRTSLPPPSAPVAPPAVASAVASAVAPVRPVTAAARPVGQPLVVPGARPTGASATGPVVAPPTAAPIETRPAFDAADLSSVPDGPNPFGHLPPPPKGFDPASSLKRPGAAPPPLLRPGRGGRAGPPARGALRAAHRRPGILRRDIYERLRTLLAPERPPTYLGPEEARAIARVLALLESLASADDS